jgi:hypothetical protein
MQRELVAPIASSPMTSLDVTGRGLDQISVAIDQETSPAEMRCQPEGAVEPLGEDA